MPKPEIQKIFGHFDPLMHVVVMPILLLNLIAVIHIAKAQWPKEPLFHIWLIVLAVVFLLMSVRLAGNKRPIGNDSSRG
jgi:hypothetical protein